MTFWLVIGAMTAAAVLAVLVPLLRPRAADSTRADHDLEVYRDQLGELDRELERGLLGADEAAAVIAPMISQKVIRLGRCRPQ